MEHESDGDTNYNWSPWNKPSSFDKRAGGFENWRTNRNHPSYCIVKIDQNTKKSAGDL